MSELERSRVHIPPFVPPVRAGDGAALDDDRREGDEGLPLREGLPPGFRLRHDAHYVDQLTSRPGVPQVRLLAVRDIDGLRPADSDRLAHLAESIARHGVLQPITVRARGGRFELIAGARRLAAAAHAGLTEVPCLVVQADDAHARALAEAHQVRYAEDEPAPDVPATGLREIARSAGTIGSCLHLLSDRGTLRDRVALDLIRTEVHRAGRLAQCLGALTQTPALADAALSVPDVLRQVLEGFAPELRLSGVEIAVEAEDGSLQVRGDHDWLAAGLAGALGGMLALVQDVKDPTLQVRVAPSTSRASVLIEIAQQGVTLPAWAIPRFFDATWTDRAGGYQAAVELAAAKAIVELHQGGAELVTSERGGCRLVVLLPAMT